MLTFRDSASVKPFLALRSDRLEGLCELGMGDDLRRLWGALCRISMYSFPLCLNGQGETHPVGS